MHAELHSLGPLALTIGVVLCCQTVFAEEQTGQRFVRFAAGDAIAYGVVEGDRVRQIAGDLFGQWQPTDVTHPMAAVKLLVPTRPTNVLALAGNYRSHLGDQAAHAHPELFQQQQRTSDLVHGVAETVSWASRYMTLEPGDLIYTGTPGHTPTLHPGDRVEVEIEGIGTLSNHVVAETP